MTLCNVFIFLMIRRPPRSTRTDTLFPYTTRFLSTLVEGRVRISSSRKNFQPVFLNPGEQAGLSKNGRIQLIRDADIDQVLSWKERSEEHTSELQSLMRNSYAVFCLKKKTHTRSITNTNLRQITHSPN